MYLSIVTEIRPVVWWQFVQSYPTYLKKAAAVVAVLMGGQPKGLQCNFNSDTCKLCTDHALDNPTHVLFDCKALEEDREVMSNLLLQSMPHAMSTSYVELSINRKLRFLLAGAPDFYDVMKAISSYVYFLYESRKSMYDDIDMINLSM